jgi:sugar phosphate permease
MRDDTPNPQINSAKIPVGGGIAGAIFAVGSMAIFLTGIPVLRYIFSVAVVLGCGVALILHFIRHETPSTSRILSVTKR